MTATLDATVADTVLDLVLCDAIEAGNDLDETQLGAVRAIAVLATQATLAHLDQHGLLTEAGTALLDRPGE